MRYVFGMGKMNVLIDWFLYFIVYSILGWMCETVYCSALERRFVYRGFLNGPYCPVYGCGALLIILLLRSISHQAFFLFVAGVIVTSSLEYVTGWLMERLFHHKWWDYSKHKYNLHGRICLTNSILFGILCVILMRVLHPCFTYLLGRIPVLAKTILAALILIIFIVDVVITVRSVINFNRMLERLQQFKTELETRRGDVGTEFQRRKAEFRRHLQTAALKVSPIQRRLLGAFPHMRSVRYYERLSEVKQGLHRIRITARQLKKKRNSKDKD